MLDYMRALQDHFDSAPPDDSKMKKEADLIFRELCPMLKNLERTQLLQLVDIQNARREDTALHSFISGFRLAFGIFRELTDVLPYSFDQDQEERAGEIFMESLQRE